VWECDAWRNSIRIKEAWPAVPTVKVQPEAAAAGSSVSEREVRQRGGLTGRDPAVAARLQGAGIPSLETMMNDRFARRREKRPHGAAGIGPPKIQVHTAEMVCRGPLTVTHPRERVRRLLATPFAATFGRVEPGFAIFAWPALVIRRECS
jgi:hypothetical protein